MNEATPAVLSPTASITFETGRGGLPLLRIQSRVSQAEIYLHGAHVTHFQRHGEEPLLFLSESARFAAGEPIRGGIPICLPWFGPRQGQPAHGFARITGWQLAEAALSHDGACRVVLRLESSGELASEWPFKAEFAVTVAERLGLELTLTNTSPLASLGIEGCLHTYFAVGDIGEVKVCGLQGGAYQDSADAHRVKTDAESEIRIASEVDRLYFDTTQAVEILDASLGRRIRVEKRASQSTVVWNPWIEKSRRLADFGDDEYRRMVCVESGNVGPDRLLLEPGASHAMCATITSAAL